MSAPLTTMAQSQTSAVQSLEMQPSPANREIDGERRKLRVLIVSALVPMEGSGGGCLTLHRHFVLSDDFDVAVAACRGDIPRTTKSNHIRRSRVWERLRRTRLERLVRNAEYLINWISLPKNVTKFAEEFQPDIIFTIVDDAHMGLAWQLSRRLQVPLAVDFQDLFALSLFSPKCTQPYPGVRAFLLNRYRFLNDCAEVVFHIGEEMKEWFGPRGRGKILYPIADPISSQSQSKKPLENQSRPIRLVYAGNCSGAYGRMMLKLAEQSLQNANVDLKVYSRGTNWPADARRRLEEAGVFQGFLPFAELQSHLDEADAFLVTMSFEPNERVFMETSFNTKWVDSVARGKPVFVWGPPYSSAIRFAKKHGAGMAIESDEPLEVLSAVTRVFADPEAIRVLSDGARKVAGDELSARRLQQLLKSELSRAVIAISGTALGSC